MPLVPARLPNVSQLVASSKIAQPHKAIPDRKSQQRGGAGGPSKTYSTEGANKEHQPKSAPAPHEQAKVARVHNEPTSHEKVNFPRKNFLPTIPPTRARPPKQLVDIPLKPEFPRLNIRPPSPPLQKPNLIQVFYFNLT